MILHSVIVSFQRLELLQRTIESYQATVSVPYTLMVVDNGSDENVLAWLAEKLPNRDVLYLGENRYPGYACNKGFAAAKPEATHLHRSDSDMLYLPGWCEHIQERFAGGPKVALVGLRTNEEENHTPLNTGGTAVIRRDVWDRGLRYDEKAWEDDFTEDWRICQDVKAMGFSWTRVSKPSVVHLASGDTDDPYYQHSYGVRGILQQMEEANG